MTGLVIFAIAALLVGTATAQLPDCSSGQQYFPHPTNCTLYYICTGGVPILQYCPDDLWWNPILNACDWPLDSGCTAQSSTTPTTSTGQPSTETSTQDPPSTETTSIPTETTSVLPTESTSVLPTESTSIPTESTSIGISTETTAASTTTTPTTTTPTTTTPTTTTPTTTRPTTTTPTTTTTEEPVLPQSCPAVDDPDNPIRLPHETRCEWYYVCMNGNKVLYQCTEDHQFSYTQRFCFPPDEAGCDRCPTVDTGDIIRLPHESDCHLYYLCQDSTPVVHQCAVTDDHFSRTERICLSPEDAMCTLRWF